MFRNHIQYCTYRDPQTNEPDTSGTRYGSPRIAAIGTLPLYLKEAICAGVQLPVGRQPVNDECSKRWRSRASTQIIDVFEEQHVISFFSVKQLIDQILGQQDPESARTNPLRLAVLQMAQRIILRIVRSRIEIFL
jgi:hypothetical protein